MAEVAGRPAVRPGGGLAWYRRAACAARRCQARSPRRCLAGSSCGIGGPPVRSEDVIAVVLQALHGWHCTAGPALAGRRGHTRLASEGRLCGPMMQGGPADVDRSSTGRRCPTSRSAESLARARAGHRDVASRHAGGASPCIGGPPVRSEDARQIKRGGERRPPEGDLVRARRGHRGIANVDARHRRIKNNMNKNK